MLARQERKEAEKLFAGSVGQALHDSLSGVKTGTFDVGTVASAKAQVREHAGLSAEERNRLKEAIANAKSLYEVKRLERILKSGRIPDSKK
jgi:U2 small nuclear ribonucleoprotein A'